MTKIKQQLLLAQSGRSAKPMLVASMDDLVEDPPRSEKQSKEGVIRRFWGKVKKGAPNECWMWLGKARKPRRSGNKFYGSYAYINISGVGILAHRLSYLIHHGSIDPDLVVRHTCDNTQCVNPNHLIQGTQKDNIGDAVIRGRWNSRGENCPLSKLTEGQVLEIRRRREGGERGQDLAKEYGVDRRNIYDIFHRLTWKHI